MKTKITMLFASLALLAAPALASADDESGSASIQVEARASARGSFGARANPPAHGVRESRGRGNHYAWGLRRRARVVVAPPAPPVILPAPAAPPVVVPPAPSVIVTSPVPPAVIVPPRPTVIVPAPSPVRVRVAPMPPRPVFVRVVHPRSRVIVRPALKTVTSSAPAVCPMQQTTTARTGFTASRTFTASASFHIGG